MKKTFIIILLLLAASGYAQNISDVLEKSLSGVVTVAVNESQDDEIIYGVKGNESNIAYEKALDLSNFNACGSGFVVEQNGKKYVITNAHVIASAKAGQGNINVFSISRDEYEMEVVGGDSFYDLAVLEFITPPGTEITSLAFRQDEIRIGEAVYAIGNPKGIFPYSVSDGIISAKNRVRNVAPTGRIGFLQSTASVFQGNSGGPLIDKNGLVVGVNSQLYATDFAGQPEVLSQINFALEAKVAQRIMNDVLTNNGMVIRAFLGLQFSQYSKYYENNTSGEGIWIPVDSLPVITGVIPGSPASAHTEVLKGAIVYAINGCTIDRIEQIQEEIEKVQPDKDVTLSVIASGKKQDVTIHSQTLDHPQLNSICRYYFETENGSTLAIGSSNEVIFKTGTGKSVAYNQGYSTKKASGLFSTVNQEKIVIAAGLDGGEGSAMMWRINSLSDLGAALRLCGSYGIISLRLIDRNSLDAVPETVNISFSDNDLIKRTLWY